MRRLWFALPALLLPAEGGATLLELPRPALCARAAVVVVGEVTGAEARWTDEAVGGLETRWDIAVLDTPRGPGASGVRPGDSLVLRTPGGVAGGLRLEVSTAPRLAQDHLYLLLLRAEGDAWVPVGEAQGVIPLRRGPEGPGEALPAALQSLEPCRVG